MMLSWVFRDSALAPQTVDHKTRNKDTLGGVVGLVVSASAEPCKFGPMRCAILPPLYSSSHSTTQNGSLKNQGP